MKTGKKTESQLQKRAKCGIRAKRWCRAPAGSLTIPGSLQASPGMLSGHVRGPGLRRRKERSAPGTAPRPALTTGGKGTVSVGEASGDRRCLPGGGEARTHASGRGSCRPPSAPWGQGILNGGAAGIPLISAFTDRPPHVSAAWSELCARSLPPGPSVCPAAGHL